MAVTRPEAPDACDGSRGASAVPIAASHRHPVTTTERPPASRDPAS
jgi:hypothetical protein